MEGMRVGGGEVWATGEGVDITCVRGAAAQEANPQAPGAHEANTQEDHPQEAHSQEAHPQEAHSQEAHPHRHTGPTVSHGHTALD